jgi:hypothetical protein
MRLLLKTSENSLNDQDTPDAFQLLFWNKNPKNIISCGMRLRNHPRRQPNKREPKPKKLRIQILGKWDYTKSCKGGKARFPSPRYHLKDKKAIA